MTPGSIFSFVNSVALCGWLILIFFGRRSWAQACSGTAIPLLFAVAYTILIAAHWHETRGGFSTLAAVAALFENRWLLLAGWIHYLAFDLFIGSWQVRDATRGGLPQAALIPNLILTFLFGPAGLLLYFGVRALKTRSLQVAGDSRGASI